MKYIIHKIVKPEFLQTTEMDGYYQKTIHRCVFERLYENGVNEEHESMESALQEIEKRKDDLKHFELTIIPIITISWDGTIR